MKGHVGAQMEHRASKTSAVSMISDKGEQHAAEKILPADGEMGAAATTRADAAECNSEALSDNECGGEDDQRDICELSEGERIKVYASVTNCWQWMEKSDIHICAPCRVGADVEKSRLAVFSLFISTKFMKGVRSWTCQKMTGKGLKPAP